MVEVAAGVEVDQGEEGVLGGDVVGGDGGGELLGEVVVGGYVGVVVVFVVELHDLAGDGGLEGGVVVWEEVLAGVGFGAADADRAVCWRALEELTGKVR